MTNQEAFDKMVQHLRSLKERSMNPSDVCCYNGSKCAVGALMTDEEQEAYGDFEGDAYSLLKNMQLKGHKSLLHNLDLNLLETMQDLHDFEFNWSDEGFDAENKARKIAQRFNLVYTKP